MEKCEDRAFVIANYKNKVHMTYKVLFENQDLGYVNEALSRFLELE